MNIVRVYPLRDRYEGQIKVLAGENKVVLGGGGFSRKKWLLILKDK